MIFLPINANANIRHELYSMPCSMGPEPAVNGVIYLPTCLPGPSVTTARVAPYFWKWRNSGTWEKQNRALVKRRRVKAGREASPSVGIINSQSIKGSECGVVPKGCDGHKKVNGRKRHLIVDTLGLVLAVVVHAADHHNYPAARSVVSRLADQGFERLNQFLADSAYANKPACWMKKIFGIVSEVVKVSELTGFQPGRRSSSPNALEG